jgi:hypothetical protein
MLQAELLATLDVRCIVNRDKGDRTQPKDCFQA